MRVIAGKYRSRQLKALEGIKTRPTSDRLRETLFNVVAAGAPPLEDSVWIDLYAGTGAVAIEALSRGARMVYLVESSRAAVRLIRENLQALDISEGFQLIESEAAKALRQLDAAAVAADFVFLDPPYADEEAYEQTLGFLSQSRSLGESSVVIAEHDKRFDPGAQVGALARYRLLKQGDAALSFYRRG